MRLSRFQALASLLLAAVLSAPAFGTNTDTKAAIPGTLNYVEGQASIGDQTLQSNDIGSAQLQAGQTLSTNNGKAELLLTPGVFLRLGSNSSVHMISPGLATTEVAVDHGSVMLEVSQIYSQNDIRITEDGATTRIQKTGLYAFDATQGQIRVFDGKAEVLDGDRHVTVKGGHEVSLNEASQTGKLKARGFDKDQYKDSDLYRFSSLRSSYLAEANESSARVYVSNGWYGPGWIGSGWYWNPWFRTYTFIPANGVLYSPFGWGFYSPLFAYRAPVIVGGFRHFGAGYRAPAVFPGHRGAFGHSARRPAFHAQGPRPRFHGPAGARPHGGFHGQPSFHGGAHGRR
jgi:FecR-like protein